MTSMRTVLLCAFVGLCHADIPHEDPGLMFRDGDQDSSGDMDEKEMTHFFGPKRDGVSGYNGKVIADMAGGKDRVVSLMDKNKNGKVCADEFLAHVSPSYHKAIAAEDFDNADTNSDHFLSLVEYKNSNYAIERVPEFIDKGFEEHFKQLDANEDQQLSKEEYVTAAGEDHFAQMDYNDDGIVTYPEFRKHKHTHYWTQDGNKEVPPEADNTQAGFDQLDLNQDGKITRSEEAYALMPSQEEVQAQLARGDDDHDDDHDENADIGAED